MGEALRGMRELAIGEITINSRGERVIDDYGWNPEFDQLETGNIIPFGRISVFVGMIQASGPGFGEKASDSVSGATTMVQSDGEESVGTVEVDFTGNAQAAQSANPAWVPRKAIDEDSESILELFEDRYGYGIEEEEEYESSPGPVRRVGVYTAPAINLGQVAGSPAAATSAEAATQSQQNQQQVPLQN